MKLMGVFVLMAVPAAAAGPVTKAAAVVYPLSASGVTGVVAFAKADGGVKVSVKLAGLKPGTHGFHIHEFGDCSAADGTSAGGHFNPTGDPHAGPKDDKRHEGDMGNIEADKDGMVDARVRRREAQLRRRRQHPGPRGHRSRGGGRLQDAAHGQRGWPVGVRGDRRDEGRVGPGPISRRSRRCWAARPGRCRGRTGNGC